MKLKYICALLWAFAASNAIADCGSCSTRMSPDDASLAGHIMGSGAGVVIAGSVMAANPVAGALIGGLVGGAMGPRLLRCPAAQHILRNTGVIVAEDNTGTSLLMDSEHLFLRSTNPVIIRPQYMPILDKVRTVVQMYPKLQLWVTAYTDNVFPEPYRTQVSEYQARAVADYLMANGVDPKRIVAVMGGSSTRPISTNRTVEGRDANRRVEITLRGDVA
jgi:outer membrane protein OmpA-like peptidoglycan-associated protein